MPIWSCVYFPILFGRDNSFRIFDPYQSIHVGVPISKLAVLKSSTNAGIREGTFQSAAEREIISLVLNISVTACTECLGFIHSVSLRWALYHEDRLRLNSNIRLITSAKKFAANSWYTNAMWALLLTFSYSSASQVIIGQLGYTVNAIAIAVLGASLFVQAILAVWCIFWSKSKIVSWNSSPLNTTLALEHSIAPLVAHAQATVPKARQPSSRASVRHIKPILMLIWIIFPLIIVWGVIMWFLAIKNNGHQDRTFGTKGTDGVDIPGSSVSQNEQLGLALLVITAIQLVYTMTLHTVEQVFNISRDEKQWRRAGDLSRGATIRQGSTVAAFTSWESLFLLAIKPISHWLFGLSVSVLRGGYVTFHPLPIFVLALVCLALAVYVTVLTGMRPEGPQPATWGDLKKLRQMIHDWGQGHEGKLFWGDKGQVFGSTERVAGTSGTRSDLSGILMDGTMYTGLQVVED